MRYPPFDPANPGEPFDLGGHILHALGMRRAPLGSQEHARRKKEKPKLPGPRGRSRFVGVHANRGGWVAQWTIGSRRVTGRRCADQLAAAWERARALGLDEPEVRRCN